MEVDDLREKGVSIEAKQIDMIPGTQQDPSLYYRNESIFQKAFPHLGIELEQRTSNCGDAEENVSGALTINEDNRCQQIEIVKGADHFVTPSAIEDTANDLACDPAPEPKKDQPGTSGAEYHMSDGGVSGLAEERTKGVAEAGTESVTEARTESVTEERTESVAEESIESVAQARTESVTEAFCDRDCSNTSESMNSAATAVASAFAVVVQPEIKAQSSDNERPSKATVFGGLSYNSRSGEASSSPGVGNEVEAGEKAAGRSRATKFWLHDDRCNPENPKLLP
jgi:hypothetical protein